jgi:probable HAF family extracellular repeat protein
VTLGQLNGGDTEARGINNRGHVVGFATFEDITQRAFLWTPEHGMQDLGLPEGTIRSRATAINDAGHIAVEAEIEDGSRNVLERPSSGSTAPGWTWVTWVAAGRRV